MGEWLTDQKVLEQLDQKGKFDYKGEIHFDRTSNQDFYGSPERLKQIIEEKGESVSDDELLLALFEGDEKLAEEFKKYVEPDLTSLHKVGAGHDKFITRMIGIVKNRIVPFFADDDFKFLISKEKE